MVVSRHFENGSMVLSQPRIIHFWCADVNFDSENGHVMKNKNYYKFKLVDGRHLENCG